MVRKIKVIVNQKKLNKQIEKKTRRPLERRSNREGSCQQELPNVCIRSQRPSAKSTFKFQFKNDSKF
jgi:hypothetical protein